MKIPARLRALPLGLISIVALVAISALFPRNPLQDAATFENVLEVSLRRPMGYLLIAPISNVLDTLTLLSLRQHIALFVTILVCYAIWWWFFGRALLVAVPPNRRWLREVARIGVGLVVIIGVYVVAMIMPRPMVGIETSSDIMVIDFHAHTKFSHDGRPDWRPEDVRAWHRAAGFDVAYITDHRTFEGARDAWANNPLSAGTGTVLLPGIEVVWRGEHVNVLDADRMYRGILTETLRDIDESALTLASSLQGNEPVLIETFPGDLSKVIAANGPGTAGIRAIEVIDGAPKGLGQTREERARIVHLADSTNLALVAGSNHHGWGHTAAGWTLMFLPQWRAATPDQLSANISRIIRGGGRKSTRVVERYVADTETGLALPLTVPLVAWGMLRSLSGDERVVWLAWTAAIYLMWRFRRSRLNRTAEA
jgi:predicted metal-dependent phosphoesterase TrpH